MKSKQYCTCKSGSSNYVGLPYCGLTYRNKELWVHADCSKPTLPVWESYLRNCISCWDLAYLPWEALCKDCSEQFKGSSWAKKEREKWLNQFTIKNFA